MRRLFEGGAYSSNYCNWQLKSLLHLGQNVIKFFTTLLHLGQLRNGKRAACNHGVMDARGRLLSKKEA